MRDFFQIASSTWAIHLLKLNNMKTEQCHRAVGRKVPPLSGRERQKFLKTATTFLVVRDPFERLVSAYLDKLAKLNPDPRIQPKRRQIARYIKNKFRTEARCHKHGEEEKLFLNSKFYFFGVGRPSHINGLMDQKPMEAES